jgi:hypothetical protein
MLEIGVVPNGFAINIVMSTTDPSAYPLPWQSVHDYPYGTRALADIQIIQSRFGTGKTLVGPDATSENILNTIYDVRDRMAENDTLLISYAGHGGFIPDENELWTPNRSFKAWAVYDRFLLAGEILRALRNFKPKRRVLIISDCCYCGYLFTAYPETLQPTGTPLLPGETPATIRAQRPRGPLVPDNNLKADVDGLLGADLERVFGTAALPATPPVAGPAPVAAPNPTLIRIPNPSIAELQPEYQRLKVTYDRIRDSLAPEGSSQLPIPVVALLACSGDEEACAIDDSDGAPNAQPYSLFTSKLRIAVKIEDQPNYGRVMSSVQNQIVDFMVNCQRKSPQWPQLGMRGPAAELATFVASTPFEP